MCILNLHIGLRAAAAALTCLDHTNSHLSCLHDVTSCRDNDQHPPGNVITRRHAEKETGCQCHVNRRRVFFSLVDCSHRRLRAACGLVIRFDSVRFCALYRPMFEFFPFGSSSGSG